MPKITFITGKDRKTVDGTQGETLLKIALDANVPIEYACGGNGFCMTCKCRVQKGVENLSPLNDREEMMGMANDERLGCQATVQGDVTVQIEM
ncbi:MAG: 2Fe-2S iron-sulfur cluster-binding protein [Candidatus Peregrinibacteria bacterium]